MPEASSGCPSCDQCAALLRDKDFVFRSMWGAEPWKKWPQPFQLYDSCFARVRDNHAKHQDVDVYFDETAAGTHCNTNWYVTVSRTMAVFPDAALRRLQRG
jgi:hypothetical protein